MLNTNGSRPKVIEELMNEDLIDRVAIDVKAPLNPKSYAAILGAELGNVPSMVKWSLEICKERGGEDHHSPGSFRRTWVRKGYRGRRWRLM